MSEDSPEGVASTRAATKLAKTIHERIDLGLRLRASSAQAFTEASNMLANGAQELSADLSYEDMTVLLRAVASAVLR